MTYISSWSTSELAYLAALLWLVFAVLTVFRRLYFSRYAGFPGPKLAAMSHMYMFWYDAVGHTGRYIWKIQELHREYNSPIIRISPDELHVIDPDFFEVLFSGGATKRNKPPRYSHSFGQKDAHFGTISHEQHRVRRAALSPFFSTASTRALEPLVHEVIDELLTVLKFYDERSEPVPLKAAFASLTSEIITRYCFGTGEGYVKFGFMSMVLKSTEELLKTTHIANRAHWLVPTIEKLPDKWIDRVMGEGAARMHDQRRYTISKISKIIEAGSVPAEHEYRTIFHEVLENKTLPDSDKTVERLWQEGQTLLAAGTVTTAQTLTCAIVYLLVDQEKGGDKLVKLVKELEAAAEKGRWRGWRGKPERMSLNELERLPYLHAVIQETFRLSSAVSLRIVRSAPYDALKLGDYVIPPDTAISMSPMLIHHNPDLFPSPLEFIPERWLTSESEYREHKKRRMEEGQKEPRYQFSYHLFRPDNIPGANPKYLVPFAKGSRACLGMNLAYSECYIGLARVIRGCFTLEIEGEGAREKGDVRANSPRRDSAVEGVSDEKEKLDGKGVKDGKKKKLIAKGMKLYETGIEDVEAVRDFSVPFPAKGKGNVQVVLEYSRGPFVMEREVERGGVSD